MRDDVILHDKSSWEEDNSSDRTRLDSWEIGSGAFYGALPL